MTFVLQTVGSPVAMVPEITRLVHEFDPNLPLGATRTMEEVASRSVAARRWSATLLACSRCSRSLSPALASTVSWRNSSRRERAKSAFASRSAHDRAPCCARSSAKVIYTLSGLALGLAVSFAAMRGLQALLFEVRPSDPLTLIIVGVTLLTVAVLASLDRRCGRCVSIPFKRCASTKSLR